MPDRGLPPTGRFFGGAPRDHGSGRRSRRRAGVSAGHPFQPPAVSGPRRLPSLPGTWTPCTENRRSPSPPRALKTAKGRRCWGLKISSARLGLSLKEKPSCALPSPGTRSFPRKAGAPRTAGRGPGFPGRLRSRRNLVSRVQGDVLRIPEKGLRILPLLRGHRNLFRGRRERRACDQAPCPLMAEEGGQGVAREMAARPAGGVSSPEGTAEGRREAVPWRGVHLMRKDGETHQVFGPHLSQRAPIGHSGYDRGVDPKNRTARVGEDRR